MSIIFFLSSLLLYTHQSTTKTRGRNLSLVWRGVTYTYDTKSIVQRRLETRVGAPKSSSQSFESQFSKNGVVQRNCEHQKLRLNLQKHAYFAYFVIDIILVVIISWLLSIGTNAGKQRIRGSVAAKHTHRCNFYMFFFRFYLPFIFIFQKGGGSEGAQHTGGFSELYSCVQ